MDSRNENPINEIKQTEKSKRGRWETILQWGDILSSILSLLASLVVGVSINFFTSKITPEIPTSFVVAFSIGIGVAIILYISLYLYRRQTSAKKIAISEMQKFEQDFFNRVDVEISALLSEKVNYG